MITGIEIENFKGIRERVKLDFRPITLLFGANSAGKSTILHALHYAREVFERHNLDADVTIGGGEFIDLGGFRNFVHQPDKPLMVEIQLSPEEGVASPIRRDERLDCFESSPMFDQPELISVAITIEWSEIVNQPVVTAYTVQFENEVIAQIDFQPGRKSATASINLNHPSIVNCTLKEYDELKEFIAYSTDYSTSLEISLDECRAMKAVLENSEELGVNFDYRIRESLLFLELDLEDAFPTLDWLGISIAPSFDPEVRFELQAYACELIHDTIAAIFIGSGSLVRDALQNFRYLGPLRQLPPRNYQPPRFQDPTRWASGLGAWDRLQIGPEELVNEVSTWLNDSGNLDAGFRIEQRTYREINQLELELYDLLNERVEEVPKIVEWLKHFKEERLKRSVILPASGKELRPHDVGIGVSQVVPVVVTTLDGVNRLLAIEQPELHIHPRLQAQLGDLFIEGVRRKNHNFIIETHSEHLILRLLRRIRETEVGKAPPGRTLRTDELAIYYLRQEDGISSAMPIDVDVNGEFIQPWPDDFFEIDFFERFPDAR